MKLYVTTVTEVAAPDEATHFSGDVEDGIKFYKSKDIGVAGDHWFEFDSTGWSFCGHRKPAWIQEIPIEWRRP
jgi:hypothetical protein